MLFREELPVFGRDGDSPLGIYDMFKPAPEHSLITCIPQVIPLYPTLYHLEVNIRFYRKYVKKNLILIFLILF